MDYELAVIGAGPAGVAAGIYAVRAGISTIVLEEKLVGGQIVVSPWIENYPGYENISGMDLAEIFKNHLKKYIEPHELEPVKSLTKTEEGFGIVTSKGKYEVKAVVFATGAIYRTLGVPGERKFSGKGISYCATCDGFFFRDKKVAVVGGGNTAAVEALYLKNLGMDVHMIHRRDQLRAEMRYQEELEKKGVNIVYDTVVCCFNGDEKLESIELKDVNTEERRTENFDGAFVSIGLIPNTGLVRDLGVEVDDNGYIKVDDFQRTNVKGVYAAGDITGGARQIVTSCAQGAQAALASTEVLGKQYPF
ncbi:MAG: FAD-dependent oxidoreductase [Methanobacteriota archaeon]|nr:MAG: FAD-dependent oxidoreductase [Euryarchaeota archaeon]